MRTQYKVLFSIFLFLILSTSTAFAQISSSNAFLQGTYLEVGVAANGAFGTTVDVPGGGGYHPRSGLGNSTLGFVVDRGKDGWAVGSPAYDGDFFLPGTPYEGWSVKFNGTTSNNNRSGPVTQIAGAVSNYTNAGGVIAVDWSGTVSNLQVDKVISITTTGTDLNVDVTLTNNSGALMTGIYYLRIFDPDNNVTLNSNYATTNTIESQPPAATVALVSSTQTDGSFIALFANDTRARAGRSCLSVDGQTAFEGTQATLTGSATSDVRTCLAFSLGDLAAGQSVNFRYKYTLSTPVYDFGDAPSTYPVTQASSGARHLLPDTGNIFLGASVDDEADGQPTADADGDDTTGTDDEDGITISGNFAPFGTVNVTAVSSGTGKLNAFIDFNGDSDWTDSGEQVLTDSAVVAGSNALSFTMPATFVAGSTAARFRLDTAGGLTSTGTAADGEVEDYKVTLVAGVADVSSTSDDGSYLEGQTITITVKFNEAVDVTGTPQLKLNTGGTATYASGSGTDTLSFTYIVERGDRSSDLDYLSTTALELNGGTILSSAAAAVMPLTLAAPGAAHSLAANKSIGVDGGGNAPLDFDGDGITDVTYSTVRERSKRLYLTWFASDDSSEHQVSINCEDCSPVPADYDGDGAAEPAFVIRRKDGKELRWHFLNNEGVLQRRLTFGQSDDTAIAGCNFNATEEKELAFLRRGRLHFRTLASSTVVKPGFKLKSSHHVMGCGDVDGDGIDELLVNEKNRRLVVYTVAGVKLFSVASKRFTQTFVADIDGNGINEVGTFRQRNKRDSVAEFYQNTAPHSLLAAYEMSRDASVLNGKFESSASVADGAVYRATSSAIRQRLYSETTSTPLTFPTKIRKLHTPVVVHE